MENDNFFRSLVKKSKNMAICHWQARGVGVSASESAFHCSNYRGRTIVTQNLDSTRPCVEHELGVKLLSGGVRLDSDSFRAFFIVLPQKLVSGHIRCDIA